MKPAGGNDVNFVGLGGRVGFNVNPNIALEGEMSYDFEKLHDDLKQRVNHRRDQHHRQQQDAAAHRSVRTQIPVRHNWALSRVCHGQNWLH